MSGMNIGGVTHVSSMKVCESFGRIEMGDVWSVNITHNFIERLHGGTDRPLSRWPYHIRPVLRPKEELIFVQHEGKAFRAEGDTIGAVKMYILESKGISIRYQALAYMGAILGDAEDARRFAGKTLEFFTAAVDARSLTVGAGRNIVQHIERDDNGPRMWEVASSKILNVQILDARTFKLVTGRNPPETPATPDMYQRLDLPFYQLWRDGAAPSGVTRSCGPLAGVKEAASLSVKPGVVMQLASASKGKGRWQR